MESAMLELPIIKIEKETDDCVSIYLDKTNYPYDFKPGQFVDVEIVIEDQPLKRSYSISSITSDEFLRLTVKKVANGYVSRYINENLKSGESLKLSAPNGRFIPVTDPIPKIHVFVSAGSGITPAWSMIQHLLHSDSHIPIVLFYGNRKSDNIIFDNVLKNAASKYEGRFEVFHYLTKPKTLLGLISKEEMTYKKGRIDVQDVVEYIFVNSLSLDQAAFYICGPNSFNDSVKKQLLQNECPAENIRLEFFTEGESGSGEDFPLSNVRAQHNGEEISVQVEPGQTILEALIDEGHDPPHSCTSGACCTCIALLKLGQVEMERHDALSKAEIKQGYILTCQSRPKTEKVVVNYDID